MQKMLIHSKRESSDTAYVAIHQREADYGIWDFTAKEFVEGDESEHDVAKAVPFDDDKKRYVIDIPEGLPVGKEYDIVIYAEEARETTIFGCQMYLDKTKGFTRPGPEHTISMCS